ncbi:hypothetical protein PILCRDRAFT_814106 [Piloderma croceum F 1598]|uniref:Uncharacterized protein n=1 Tax=Piloderma croceum (strain F 1598) TaxID=765440 RepID=A0A0C3FUY3_PILCF|nr:hypothetical protein PILCRDRAFT_814106 [Piloderma croceum F 1598]
MISVCCLSAQNNGRLSFNTHPLSYAHPDILSSSMPLIASSIRNEFPESAMPRSVLHTHDSLSLS